MGSSLTDTSRSFAKRARPGTSRRAWHWTLHRSGVTPSHWWSWSSMWKIRGWSLGARSMLRSKKRESKLSHLHTILFSQSFTTERFKMQANILHAPFYILCFHRPFQLSTWKKVELLHLVNIFCNLPDVELNQQ